MKSVFGLNENIAAALSYVIGPVTGIFVLIAERENKFVRFHALQSTLWFLFLWIVRWVVGFIVSLITGLPLLGGIFGFVLSPLFWVWGVVYIISKIFLVLRAALGHDFKLPYVGEAVWNQIYK